MATLVKTRDGRWQALIRLADRSRKRWPPGGFPRGMSEPMARDKAEWAEQEAKKRGTRRKVRKPPRAAQQATTTTTTTSNSQWFAAWIADRQRRGLTSTGENEQHYRLHIEPAIGDKHISDWTEDDLRRLVRALDGRVQAGKLAWKSAQNVWGTATRMCKDACRSKDDALRVRTNNPAKNVEGPDRGAVSAKQFLFPAELSKLLACESVPLHWRRCVAVAVYTYMRAAELRALRWEDVDLEHGTIHVHRATSRTTGEDKSTKGRHARRYSIEPTLLPLLRALLAERAEATHVIDVPHRSNLSSLLRRFLLRAGADRAELHETTATRKAMTWHDLRSTGLTWMAIRGDDPLKIQQRAGHTDFKTTQGYIRTAEELREGFGEPFPELPASLLGCTQVAHAEQDQSQLSERMVASPGVEPDRFTARP